MTATRLLAVLLVWSASLSLAQSALLYHREGTLSTTAARPTTPRTWTATSVAPPTAPHTITIAMPLQNLARMQQLFRDIHDPGHEQWLQHLSRDQVHAMVAPPQQQTDRLLQWIQHTQAVPAEHVSYLLGANAIRVASTVEHINRLFNTTMHQFTHTDGQTAYRQLGASYVPDEFVPLIELVDGLAMMPYILKKHMTVIEMDGLAASKKQADGSGEEHRHSAAASSEHGSEDGSRTSPVSSAPPASGLGLPGCSFKPIVPVNSLYGLYNISDQSMSAIGSNPQTSTQTTQFFTYNGNNLEANSFSPTDLTAYSRLWSATASPAALKVWTVTGPNDAANPTGEPSLDVQAITSIAPLAANQFELTASGGQQYWFSAGFVSRENVAQVVSISYGGDESQFLSPKYQSYTLDGLLLSTYLRKTNELYMLIGARGTTLLVSSGDDGAQGVGNAVGFNGTVCNYASSPYDPSGPAGPTVEFPASSPYVTAVGGTEVTAACSAFTRTLPNSQSPFCNALTASLLPQYGVQQPGLQYPNINCLNPALGSSESAVSLSGSGYTSGGGFSRYWTRSTWASWQDSVVNQFLSGAGTRPSAALFNRTGRAIPDVAMYGGSFPIIYGGSLAFVVGTSVSAPLFAGVIAILNQQTLAAKGATIGFANPLLYAMAANDPQTFKDITAGDNLCPADQSGAQTCSPACQGYTAGLGWDPVTGLGVPNVGAMQDALGRYLYLTNPTHTGSVTGITGASYGGAAGTASASVLVSVLLVVGCIAALLSM